MKNLGQSFADACSLLYNYLEWWGILLLILWLVGFVFCWYRTIKRRSVLASAVFVVSICASLLLCLVSTFFFRFFVIVTLGSILLLIILPIVTFIFEKKKAKEA